MPPVEHFAEPGAQEFRARNFVNDTRRNLVTNVEVCATTIQVEAVRIIYIQTPAKTAGGVYRLTDRVTELEIQSLTEALLHAQGSSVIGRVAIGLSVADDAEARIQAIEPAVEQISTE